MTALVTAASEAAAPSVARRLRQAGATALALAVLAGCGSFWPWSSSKPKIPDPPPVTGSIAARVAWNLRVGPGGAGFAPVVAAGSVFAAAADGTVMRVDAATGGVAWRVNLDKRLSAGVGSDGDTVAVAARDGTLLALDGEGKQKWTAALGGEAVTVPAVGLGLVIVRSSDNRVSAFETDTGKRRWTFQRQNPPLVLRQTASVAITPGTVFVGLPGGRLVALSLENGAVRWEGSVSQPRGATEIERIADVVGTPLVSGRELCASSFQGKIACFDLPSGRAMWSRDVSTPSGIEVDARLVSAADDRDHVHAFSRTGASVWKQDKLAQRGLSAPLSLGPVLVLGDIRGLVHLLSRDDGAIVGRFATDGTAIECAPVASGRAAVVLTSGGALLSIVLD